MATHRGPALSPELHHVAEMRVGVVSPSLTTGAFSLLSRSAASPRLNSNPSYELLEAQLPQGQQLGAPPSSYHR